MVGTGWSANYYPYGEMASQSGSNEDTHFDFTGHERDAGTGLIYAGARFYEPEIGRWLSVDPLGEKYPGWSPYNYTLNNPTRFIDPKGTDTITDSTGKVIHVNQNNDLSIYRTYTKTGGINDLGIPNGPRSVKQKVGATLAWNSFLLNGDPEQGPIGIINFGSFEARDFIISSAVGIAALNRISPFQGLIFYITNADNLGLFDFKSWGGSNPQNIYRGSQLSEGIYLSARDAGNYLAGFVASISGIPEEIAMRALGAFNLGGNSYMAMLSYFFNNPVGPPTYGELPLSSQFQRFGYHGTGMKH
ncbi:MAG: RHS repeat-associated core domain-containing protein [Calditrichaeota bacterium]|nr:MAG: RHS repeat-associated core domain-containing protein [Calditrichota bacterium]